MMCVCVTALPWIDCLSYAVGSCVIRPMLTIIKITLLFVTPLLERTHNSKSQHYKILIDVRHVYVIKIIKSRHCLFSQPTLGVKHSVSTGDRHPSSSSLCIQNRSFILPSPSFSWNDTPVNFHGYKQSVCGYVWSVAEMKSSLLSYYLVSSSAGYYYRSHRSGEWFGKELLGVIPVRQFKVLIASVRRCGQVL